MPWTPEDNSQFVFDPRAQEDEGVPDVSNNSLQSLACYLRLGFGDASKISHVTLQHLDSL